MDKSVVHFKTNTGIKNIIGQELINDDNIAILELVKNSFDALATEVSVEFYAITEEWSEQKIIITDNGTGMSVSDIKDKWLNIAYSEKKEEQNKAGRPMAGAKGVGRFSCDRLGQQLNIYSRIEGSNTITQLTINWLDFEENKIEKKIEEIDVFLYEVQADIFFEKNMFPDFIKGTIVEITELRSEWTYYQPVKKEWNKDKLIGLKSDLEKLINPNQNFSKIPFKIELLISDYEAGNHFKEISGVITSTIFKELDFKVTSIESSISENGDIISTKVNDRGREVLSFTEKGDISRMLPGVKIKFYFMSPYSKVYFKKQTGTRTVHFGSIFIFINGFRISPYGSEGDDWLGIEKRKGQGYARNLGTREIIGRVEVTDKEGRFQIVSSREGLVDNMYFNCLQTFATITHRRLEKYVVDGISWDTINAENKSERDRKLQEFEELSEELSVKDLEKREDFLISEDQVLKNLYEVIFQIINIQGGGKIKNVKIDDRILNKVIDESSEKKDKFIDKIKKISLKDGQSVLMKKLLDSQKVVKVLKEEKETQDSTIKQLKEVARKQDVEIKEKDEDLNIQKGIIKEQTISIEKKEEENSALRAFQVNPFYENVVDFYHDVSIASSNIDSSLSDAAIKIENHDLKGLENTLEIIKFENSKVLSISKIATRSGMQEGVHKRKMSLNKKITDYLNDYANLYSSLNIQINNNTNIDFKIAFRYYDLVTVLDNLLNNSRKHKAKNINVKLSNESNELTLLFSDDGTGLHKKYLSNPDQIFDKKVGTTNGAGWGLYQTKDILETMFNALINVKVLEKGLAFKIVFKKGT